MRKLCCQWAGVVLILLGCSSMAIGQTTFGSITGTVTDPTGAMVPDVQVTLTNLGTNVKQVQTTNAAGIYEFVNVLPTEYRLDAVKMGFQHFTRQPVVVQVQQSYRIDIELALGAVTQTVEVTAATPHLQPQTSSLTQVIAGRAVTEIPLNGRNVYNLMSLVSGVTPGGESGGTPVGENPFGWNNYAINGAFGGTSAMYVDGAPVTGSGYINEATYIPSQDYIQEFNVQTNNLGPEWGRFEGGVMNLTTKSGTNAIHGAAYEYLRNKVLNANTFFGNKAGNPRPPFTQNQFGANAGGPIYLPNVYDGRNRSFWFFGWEGFRLRQGVTFTDTVPTAAEQLGDFSNLRDKNGNLIPIYDPLTVCGKYSNPTCPVGSNGQPIYTRQQFSGNSIPQGRFDPTAAILQKDWAQPNTTGQPFTNVNNFTTNTSAGGNNGSVTARIDHTVSDKQRIFGRYTYWTNTNLAADPMHTGYCLYGACGELYHTNDIVLDHTYNWTPTLISDIHIGFDRMAYNRTPVVPTGLDYTSIAWPASYNSEVPADWRTVPNICVAGVSDDLMCGSNAVVGSKIFVRTNNWTTSGDITKIRGHHTLKMGLQWLVMQDNFAQNCGATSDLRFNSLFTGLSPTSGGGGFGYASYLLGDLVGQTCSDPNQVAGQYTYRAFYIGDTWQATNKLTLNIGLRYEQERPWTERSNRLSVWDFTDINPLTQSTAQPAAGMLCLVDTPCRSGRNQTNPNDKQFAPRVGFAYRLTNSTVVRGGYGIFWIPTVVNWNDPGKDPINYFASPLTYSIDGGITPNVTLNNPFPGGIIWAPGRNPNFQRDFFGNTATSYIPSNPYPYGQQWNFDVQHQFSNGFFIDAAYAGSKGTHLLPNGGRQADQLPDQYLSQGTALLAQVPNPYYGIALGGTLYYPTVAAEQLLRPFPQYAGVGIRGGFADSIYHSFQLKAQREMKGGGKLLASYTNSKLISPVDMMATWLQAGTGGVGTIQDWNCIKCSRSLSSQDIPQRVVISYVQNLPVGHGQRYLAGIGGAPGKLISGWGVDGVTTFQRGMPLVLSTSTNTTNSLGGNSRPNVVPGCAAAVPGSVEGRLNGWFNTTCFTHPAAFTFGTESRVDPVLRSQGVNNFDFALFKNTNFGRNEKLGVQFRAEFFNLFNTPQFGPPGTSFGTAQFGIVSSQVNNPRLIQFALRFQF